MITPFRRGDAQRNLSDEECFRRGFVCGPEEDMRQYQRAMNTYLLAPREVWFDASLKAIQQINGENHEV